MKIRPDQIQHEGIKPPLFTRPSTHHHLPLPRLAVSIEQCGSSLAGGRLPAGQTAKSQCLQVREGRGWVGGGGGKQHRRSYLRHGVALTQRHTLVRERVVVNCQRIWHTDLVCASIALADGRACKTTPR